MIIFSNLYIGETIKISLRQKVPDLYFRHVFLFFVEEVMLKY